MQTGAFYKRARDFRAIGSELISSIDTVCVLQFWLGLLSAWRENGV